MSLPQSSLLNDFPSINRGYNATFRVDEMTLGLVAPLESYAVGAVPTMACDLERIASAEAMGFAAIWLRDIPYDVPSFGDVGQVYDPFVYLGLLAAKTKQIALGVASVVLPLRHPAHVAKAAASVDVLSGGRMLLGLASGDRPDEYPALNIPFEARGGRFREGFDYIREAARANPRLENSHGQLRGDLTLRPRPLAGKLPLLITGGSQQTPEWIARHGDGWMIYPRSIIDQQSVISAWRDRLAETGEPAKPVMQPLYLDLLDDPNAPLSPIHLGVRAGANSLQRYLSGLRDAGVNHVALNLRFNQNDISASLQQLADQVLPEFTH